MNEITPIDLDTDCQFNTVLATVAMSHYYHIHVVHVPIGSIGRSTCTVPVGINLRGPCLVAGPEKQRGLRSYVDVTLLH